MTELRHGAWWSRIHGPVEQIMEGRFTRLFGDAEPAVFEESDLRKLAEAMTSDPEDSPTGEFEPDAEENSGIESAYTYFGQFIDHDLTLDPTSHLRERVSRDKLLSLVDFRTPRFDLDCLYGRGQTDQPYLYDGDNLLLGTPMSGNPHDPNAVDVPRGPSGRALIGDPRNDENRIVSQLQATMLRFHNRLAAKMHGASFDDIRKAVRWHYQWVIVNDFLPTIIGAETLAHVFPHLSCGGSIAEHQPQLCIAKLHGGLELMPVEFSVAAYRFGHSMIRPIYRLNETIERRPIFSTERDLAGDLGGFRAVPSDWAIDWQYFIDIEHGSSPPPRPNPRDDVHREPQPAYKIDSSLVNPLAFLPPSVASDPSSLGLRNLIRGSDFGLPSGQTVARILGKPVIDDDELLIGKGTGEEGDIVGPLAGIAPAFAGKAPLWTYVLAEAQAIAHKTPAPPDIDPDRGVPVRLGPVGGTIVAEVFAALLLGDEGSFLNEKPDFTPDPEFLHEGTFGLAQLINAAIGSKP